MILDHAAKLIAEEGVSAVSMERLGREADISKALVYNYFPSVTGLLQTLLIREYRRLRKLQLDAAESADTLEQLVRRVTNVYLSYIKENGMLIERLAAEPAVANSGDPTTYSRDDAVGYLAKIMNENFGIDMDIALPVIDISYGLPSAAGHYITHHDTNLQTIEDITVTMILGSLEAVQKKYQTSLKPLRRD
jgi:TetR/AcrR family transcriptional regulator, fatty acid biosynthesis regulator